MHQGSEPSGSSYDGSQTSLGQPDQAPASFRASQVFFGHFSRIGSMLALGFIASLAIVVGSFTVTAHYEIALSEGQPLPHRVAKSVSHEKVLGAVISNGLVGYWSFDENTGTTAADSSGNSNNGSFSGSLTWTTGKFGSALQFSNGKNLNVPDRDYGDSSWTTAAWIKTSSDGWILGHGEGSDFRIASGKVLSQLYTTSGFQNSYSSTSVTNNQWRHVAATRSGTTVKIYVDGSLNKTATISGTPDFGFNAIGARTDSSSEGFSGVIDEVYVFNRSLSDSEIQTLMAGASTPQATDTVHPTVSLTAPANGAALSGTAILSATATDDVGVVGVQFKVDGTSTGSEDTTSPYSVSLNTATLTNGSHTITATARDAAGNTSTTTAVSVTVNNTATTPTTACPTTVGTNAFLGCYFNNKDFTSFVISQTDSAIDFDWGTLGPLGSISSNTFSVRWIGNFTFEAGNYEFTSTIDDGVRLYIDGTLLIDKWFNQSVTTYKATKAMTAGSHEVKMDYYENTGRATAKLSWARVTAPPTTDTTPPAVSITAPSSGATISATTAIAVNATDNVGVVGVQFKVDGLNIGSEVITQPFLANFNTTTVSNGSHTLTATARDAANNTATSTGIPVTVSNVVATAPVINSFAASPSSITSGQSSTLSWSVTGATSLSINQNIGTVTGTSRSVSPTATTTYTLTATNSTGSTTATATVTVTAVPPTTTLPSGPLTRYAGNPIVPMGAAGSIDDEKTGPRVVLAPGTPAGSTNYRMYYEAVGGPNKAKVGYATSSDGKTWTKQGSIASLNPSTSWEGGSDGEVSPNSILIENGVYKLWYHSFGTDAKRRIGYATSTDGLNWTKNANPVLDVGSAGSLEDQYVVEPRVFKVGSTYRMYYAGNAVGNSGVGTARWFYATSNDGVSWTRRGQVWSKLSDTGFGIVFDGSKWHVWYGLAFESINYASSNDGLTWTDGPSNPVLLPSSTASAPDSGGLGDSVSAYKDGNEYRIMYTGGRFNSFGRIEAIALATILTSGSPPPPTTDTTPPAVGIIAPSSGATISATSVITVNATDNVGVAGVQFKVDGLNIGSEVTTSPFTANFNTTTVVNGGHTLTATARDAASNIATSSSVPVTISNVVVPPPNTPPTGALDGVNTSTATIFGWAQDPDNLNTPVQVHLYFDGPTTGTPLVVTASDNRSDVGNHAFNASIPSQYRNGVQHSVYAYAIDLTDTTGASNRLLSGSPKTFTIGAPPPPPTAGTCNWYVATTGSPSGNGSSSSPWDLKTALAGPSSVQDGQTICVRGGTYSGRFVSQLAGTASQPITVRAYPGERAILDGNKTTTLTAAMGTSPAYDSGQITVADPTIFSSGLARMSTITGEEIQVDQIISGNTLSVVRGWSGTCSTTGTCPGYAVGTPVRVWGNVLSAYGSYTNFQGLEVTISGQATRVSTISGSAPESGGVEQGEGIFDSCNGCKYINNIVHDTSNGFGSHAVGKSSLFYGNISYNNGWLDQQGEGYGHGFYIQNAPGNAVKTVKNNFAFHNANFGTQSYGDAGGIDNITYDGNTIFDSGRFGTFQSFQMLVGRDPSFQNSVWDNNNVFGSGGSGSVTACYGGTTSNSANIRNNYFAVFADVVCPGSATITGNTFANQTDATPSQYPNNTYLSGFPSSGLKTFVTSNQYETGRANITVYNWSRANSVTVDVSAAGLTSGQTYEIRDAQNFFASPVATGTYNGSAINLPMTASSTPVLSGSSPYQPSHTDRIFGAFVLLPTSTGGSALVTAPASAPAPAPTQTVTLTPGVSNFKYASNPTIYFLNSQSQKEAYAEAAVFLAWNVNYDSVVTIPDSQTYPDGGLVRLPEGTLVKGSASTIYQVDNGLLRPFISLEVFLSKGYSLASVITVSDGYLGIYTIGSHIVN